MIIVGCDYHPSFQQIAFVDRETGELKEQRLAHREGAEEFYRALAARDQQVRVGMEASGHARWFERLLAELQFELWMGDAAEIRRKRGRKQKTDRQDAQHILGLLLKDDFPPIWMPSWENRDLRQLLWHRHRMVQARTRIMNQRLFSTTVRAVSAVDYSTLNPCHRSRRVAARPLGTANPTNQQDAADRPYARRRHRRKRMANPDFDKGITALLVIDPYNDFISEGGKIWDRIRAVAEANGCVSHMLQVLNAARQAGLRVFYALHHRYRPGDYETWKYIAPVQQAAWSHKTFEHGTWGGEIRSEFIPLPGEIVAQEHWCSSGFANTDLDLLLKKHGIHKLIVVGLIAHTCVESTVRFAAELGYDVAVVKDAIADYSDEHMNAALVTNLPNYASAIVSAKELGGSISSIQGLEKSG